MSDRNALSGFRASLAAQATRVLASGLITLALTRYFLTPDEYGLLFLAISIFGTSLLVSRVGLPKSAARYVTEYRETDPGQVYYIVRTSLTITAGMAVLVALSLLVFREPIATIFDEPELTSLLVVGSLYVLFRTFNSYFFTIFQGFNHIDRSAYVTICSYAAVLLGVLALVALGLGPVGALSGYVLGYGLGSLLGAALLYRTLTGYSREPGEPGLRRRMLEYSVPLVATNGANVLYKRVDTLLIGFFLTPAAVAFYTLAKQISDFVIAPADSLGFTISPSYGEHKASGNPQRAARIYEQAFEYTALLYLPAAAGMVLVAEPAVELLFGAEYAGAAPVVQVFAGFVVLQAIDKITNDGLDYLGRARHRAMVKGATGGLNFGLNLVLIPAIGVVGAAISTVISFAIMVTVNVYLIHTELTLSIRRLARSLSVVVAITLGMSAVVYALLPAVSTVPTLFLVVGVGVATWGVLALASGIPDVKAVLSVATGGA